MITVSPFFFPIRELPRGDLYDILDSRGLVSFSPTIVYSFLFPFSHSITTCDPTSTLVAFFLSTITAFSNVSCIVNILSSLV
jgi:hypothetical protein